MKILENSTHLAATTLFNYIKHLSDNGVIAKNVTTIKDLQSHLGGLLVDGWFGMKTYSALYKKVLRPKFYNFEGYYHKSTQEKKQIVWHHAAGRDTATGMFYWWKVDGKEHVATSAAIDDKGVITKGYDEDYWGHHLGLRRNFLARNGILNFWTQNTILNKQSVAVEILNWGSLRKIGGRYYPWTQWNKSKPNKSEAIPKRKVIKLNYRGFEYYEKYTSAEIETLKNWTILNSIRYGINLDYSYEQMFEVNKKALKGTNGIYSHTSFRPDKTDVSPQGRLIEMTEGLSMFQK